MDMKALVLRAAAALLPLTMAQPSFALHVYGGYECKGGGVKLVYDGPGSNYAFGGYSHFYNQILNLRALAYSRMEGEGDTIGDEVGEESLEVIFSVESSKPVTKAKTSLKVGDPCEPGEVDYQTSEWRAIDTVKIQQVSEAAAKKLGLKSGAVLKMSCQHDRSVPVWCPASGRYGKEGLE